MSEGFLSTPEAQSQLRKRKQGKVWSEDGTLNKFVSPAEDMLDPVKPPEVNTGRSFLLGLIASLLLILLALFCIFLFQALRNAGTVEPAHLSFNLYRSFEAGEAWTRDVPKPETLPPCRVYEANLLSEHHGHCVLRDSPPVAVGTQYMDEGAAPCDSIYAYACGGWESSADLVFDGVDAHNFETMHMLSRALASQFDVDELFRPPTPHEGSFRDAIRDFSVLVSMCEMAGDPELPRVGVIGAEGEANSAYWAQFVPADVLPLLRSTAAADHIEALAYTIGRTGHDTLLEFGLYSLPTDRSQTVLGIGMGATLAGAAEVLPDFEAALAALCEARGGGGCAAVGPAYATLAHAAARDMRAAPFLSMEAFENTATNNPRIVLDRQAFEGSVMGSAANARALLRGWVRGLEDALGEHPALPRNASRGLEDVQHFWLPHGGVLSAVAGPASSSFVHQPAFGEALLALLALDARALSNPVAQPHERLPGGSIGLVATNETSASVSGYSGVVHALRARRVIVGGAGGAPEASQEAPAREPERGAGGGDDFCWNAVAPFFETVLVEIFSGYEVDAGAHALAEDLIEAIAQSIAQRVEDSGTLTAEGKAAMKHKLGSIGRRIGLPWEGPRPHPPLGVTEGAQTIAEALARLRARDRAFGALAEWHDRALPPSRRASRQRKYPLPGWRSNACYVPFENNINVLPGAMVPPLFHPDFSPAEQFGRLGFVSAHEFMHSIDRFGQRYDTNGALSSAWLPLADRSALRDFQQCVSLSYTTRTALGNQANGEVTNGEDTADVCGVQAAVGALYDALGGDVTPEAARNFTLSYAQTWCAKLTPFEEARRMRNAHSPPQMRVDRALEHAVLPDGRHLMTLAFQCAAPAETCKCF